MKLSNTLKMALKKVLSLKFGAVDTDKATLMWDGDEDLKAGDEVFVEVDGEDEPKPAESGEYVTEDGKVIVVVDGVVSEIRDPEAEVADEPVEESAQENVEAAEEDPAEPAEEPADEPEEEPVSDEDRIAALEARVDEIVNGINQVVNAISALEARIADVEAKLVSVEAPAADPVDDKPQEEEVKQSRMSYLRKNK